MKRTIARWSVMIAALSSVLIWQGTSRAAPDEDDTDKVFVGYLFQAPQGINYALYTHLCHAFVVPDGEGNLRPGRNAPSRELTAEAHEAGVRVLLSIGGGGRDKEFAAIASHPAAEDRFARAVMAMVDAYDYDGIDFDWEYPDTEQEVVVFERLTRRFRRGLDELGERKSRRMRLTMAVNWSPDTIKWMTDELILENYDWLNMMTYDYSGGSSRVAAHQAPLYPSSKQQFPEGAFRRSATETFSYLLEERKLPPNRLALGLPLYGRGFLAPAPYAPISNAGTPGRKADPAAKKGANANPYAAMTYNAIHRLVNEQGWKRVWDDETRTPWAVSPDGTAVIGYDDAESITIKTEWALKKGLRGVFFWQIAGDRLPDGSFPLQEAAHEALRGSPKKAP